MSIANGVRHIERNLEFLETDKRLIEYLTSGRVATDEIGFADSTETIASSMLTMINETAWYIKNAHKKHKISKEQFEGYITLLEHYDEFIHKYL